ncbi:MAG: crotonase/enoyl-CoA hydratase family protein [Planctomycetaceae bacterium]|nr:crotonase/enoyl-CoA hydratase family protein [Planctomycetaceae bacterium]
MDFNSDVFTLDRDRGVAVLWLDNPDERNAMGPGFWADLPRAMEVVAGEDDLRAVVIAARGEAFSVGLNLKTMGPLLMQSGASGSAVQQRRTLYREAKRLQAAISSVADCPKPVIAAVHGFCLGGGIDLITACDIRLAAADAVFSVRETKMALTADLGTLQRLPRVIPAGHAAELIYTGKDITAERAREIGLVNDVFPDASAVLEAALAMAKEIAANSPLAVQGSKAVMRAGEGRTVQEALDYVALWNSAFLQSDDLTEAVTAFLEKRPPKFTGQ